MRSVSLNLKTYRYKKEFPRQSIKRSEFVVDSKLGFESHDVHHRFRSGQSGLQHDRLQAC
jgi:hypothetical protein